MRKRTKTLLTIASLALMAATALPATINTVTPSAADVTGLSRTDYITQIQDDAWMADDVKSYYAVNNVFPAAVASMEAYIKIDSSIPLSTTTGTDYGVIFSSLNTDGWGTNKRKEYEYRITADRKVKFISAPDSVTCTFDTVIPANEWTHIAVTINRSNGELKLFVNGGDPKETKTVTLGTTKLAPQYRYFIGNNDKGIQNVDAFKGQIKQVTVYSEVVGKGTVNVDKAACDNGMTKFEPYQRPNAGLMGNWYWKLDEQGNVIKPWTAVDTTGNGNDALYQTQGAYKDFEFDESIDYSFVMIPDTQGLVIWNEQRFYTTVNWIEENKDDLNIAYAMHMGDIIDNAKSMSGKELQWSTASAYMSMLDGIVPYSFVLGNHDYDPYYGQLYTRETTLFNKYFQYSKYSQREDFGGAYEQGKMENVYYTLNIGGAQYMILALEYAPRDEVLAWADNVISAHPNHRVIVTTHSFVTTGGYFDEGAADAFQGRQPGNDGIEVWDKMVKKHSNIMMAFNGHAGQHDLMMRMDTGTNGNRVFSMMIDFQSFYEGSLDYPEQAFKYDEALVSVMGIDEDAKEAYIYLVNTETGKVYNTQNCVKYNFADSKNPAISASVNCVDNNHDHVCDVCSTCHKTFGNHVQATGKHTCDYCNERMSYCTDNNFDGNCDVCGVAIDGNKDHYCDDCGQKLNDCLDANEDGVCDVCGDSMYHYDMRQGGNAFAYGVVWNGTAQSKLSLALDRALTADKANGLVALQIENVGNSTFAFLPALSSGNNTAYLTGSAIFVKEDGTATKCTVTDGYLQLPAGKGVLLMNLSKFENNQTDWTAVTTITLDAKVDAFSVKVGEVGYYANANATMQKVVALDGINDFKQFSVTGGTLDRIENAEINPTIRYASVSTADEIGLIFYVELPNSASETVTGSYTIEGVEGATEVVGIYKKDQGCFAFVAKVLPKQYQKNVTLTVDGVEVATTTVEEYANRLVNSNQPQKAKDLALALIEYCESARLYFEAPETVESKVAFDVDLSSQAGAKNDVAGDVTIRNASLTIGSKMRINVYFTTENIANVTVDGNGAVVEVKKVAGSENLYVATVINVVAKHFDTTYTVTIGEDVVHYSALSYVYEIVKDDTQSSALHNLAVALYNYNVAANEYFGV